MLIWFGDLFKLILIRFGGTELTKTSRPMRNGIHLLVIVWILFVATPVCIAQSETGICRSGESGIAIPFAIYNINKGTAQITGVDGTFKYNTGDSIYISHPFFLTQNIFAVEKNIEIELQQREIKKLQSPGQDKISELQLAVKNQSARNAEKFEFTSNNQIVIQINKPDIGMFAEGWERIYSVNQIVRYKYVKKNKWYSKLYTTESLSGDFRFKEVEFKIPNLIVKSDPTMEYLQIIDDRFYNPLFPGAQSRYDYYITDTLINQVTHLTYLLAIPKHNKHFKSVKCLAVFSGRSNEFEGYSYLTVNHSYGFVEIHASNESLDGNYKIQSNLFTNGYFPRYPTHKTAVRFFMSSEQKDFKILDKKDTSDRKISFNILGHERDSSKMDEWQMQKLDNESSRNLDYLKRDTARDKFNLDKAANLGVTIYDGNLAFKLGFVDLSNVFAINKFEGLRVGLAIRTRDEFSDKGIITGNGAYAFGDSKFKYGWGTGLKLGKKQKSILIILFKDDLLEPGRAKYLGDIKDIFRNYFASRMDRIVFRSVLLQSQPTNYSAFAVSLDSYFLQPQYDYTYYSSPTDSTKNKFNFSEVTLQARLGVSKQTKLGFGQFFVTRWRFLPVFYVNFTRGFDDVLEGNYSYNKLGLKSVLELDFLKNGQLNLIGDVGIMTENTPYQVMFGAPGSQTTLGSIIVKEAFQTMPLYEFVSDRYVNVFTEYYFGEGRIKPGKFNPRLGLAWNMGWGLVEDKNVHGGVQIRDYPDGYFEAGVLFNNLLNINLYKYFYLNLGISVYYGVGSYIKDNPFVVRLTYDLKSY